MLVVKYGWLPMLFACSAIPQISTNRVGNEHSSYSTSIASMVRLLRLEKEFIQNLKVFIALMRDKLDTIKLALSVIHAKHEQSSADLEAYLSNPLNGFSLIRRMHTDWRFLFSYMKQAVSTALVHRRNYEMPTADDMRAVAAGIRRIQMTYLLKTSDMAKGLLNGVEYSAKLSSLDCYLLGRYYIEQTDYAEATSWFEIALEYYDKSHDGIYEVLGLYPALLWYELTDVLATQKKYKAALRAVKFALFYMPNKRYLLKYKKDLEMFLLNGEGCREKFSSVSNRLSCYYNTNTTPFLKLAPFKVEEQHRDPPILLYHDVVYDSEIEDLKRLSLPHLRRGLVSGSGQSKDRTTNVANLDNNASAVVERIHQRIADLTNLNWIGSDRLQVANYGLGGHFYNHVDYLNLTLFPDAALLTGNRLASLLFYLSDVDQGGETIFPILKVAVRPRKGNALFWFHLDNAGNGEERSMHAACPVLVGSKWTAIKMIYDKFQILKRPCQANYKK